MEEILDGRPVRIDAYVQPFEREACVGVTASDHINHLMKLTVIHEKKVQQIHETNLAVMPKGRFLKYLCYILSLVWPTSPKSAKSSKTTRLF